MKTKTITLAALAALLLPVSAKDNGYTPLSAHLKQLKQATPAVAAAMKIPVGSWKVDFDNGVSQICEILDSGKVSVVQAIRISAGTALAKDGGVEIRYKDDRLERWSMDGAKVVVEHWHPSSAMDEGKASVVGVANRFLNVSWNDQVSSMKVGANVRVIAYEHGGFEGASISLDGSSNHPLLLGQAQNNDWNNRISSLKIVASGEDEDEGEGPLSDNQVVIFDHSRFAGNSMTLEVGAEIPELTKLIIGAIQTPLEVHEWGTFTVLQGSDGRVIEWYQAPEKLVDLPPFVRRVGIGGKSGRLRYDWQLASRRDTIRMETPVLYFYPGGKMDVTVSAGFPNGRITEVFPPASKWDPAATVWTGSLLPPDSPERANIPVAKGATGRHYAAARAVPDAWLFQGRPRQIPILPPDTPEKVRRSFMTAFEAEHKQSIDHFIFYRGAGHGGSFELSAVQQESPGTYLMTNRNPAAVPKLFALQVRDGQTAWTTVDQLKPMAYQEGKVLNTQTFTFPAPAGPAEVVAEELRGAMVDSLHSEGLTEAEAKAMVATWDNLWFTEPGTRILAVLPQSFADTMVPLKITPTPKNIERVFVARVELITREQEQVLTASLNPGTGEDDVAAAAAQLASLKLGRYAAGGMERARTIIAQRIAGRFAELTSAWEKQQKLQATRE